MIKVYRETPEGHRSKGLRHVVQILEYERGTGFGMHIMENRQIKK